MMKTIVCTAWAAMFVFLSCSLQSARAGSGLRVLSVEGTRTADGSSATFTVEYEATVEPQVEWLDGYPRKPLQANTTFNQNKGKSVVTVTNKPNVYFSMGLKIGELRGQFFEFSVAKLPAPGTTLTQVLNLAELDIQPGDDISYRTGDDTVVTMTVDSTNGVNTNHYGGLRPFGKYIDSSGKLFMNEAFSFIKQSESISGTKTITKTTFYTSTYPINGFFSFYASGNFDSDFDNIFDYFTEYMVVSIHEDGIVGPYPPGFSQIEVKNTERQEVTNLTGCIPGFTWRCGFICEADANNVTAIVARKTGSNAIVKVETKETINTYYTLSVMAQLDMSTDFAGDYACYVTLGNGQEVKSGDIRVEKLDKAVRVVGVTRDVLANGTIKATCSVSGSNPTVLLSWEGTNDAPIPVDGTNVLSITTETTSGDDPLTIVTMLRTGSSFRSLFCQGKNLASDDITFFYA